MDRFVEVKSNHTVSTHCLLDLKYRPNSASDWIENEDEVRRIRSFLASENRLMVVTGDGGTGKTWLVELLLNELDSGLATHYNRTHVSNSHRSFFTTIKDSAKILVIDDMESFFMNVENTTPKQILSDIKTHELKTLIIVNELYTTKLTALLSKYAYDIVRMNRPSISSLLSKCISICLAEGFPHDATTLKQFVVSNNCNYRYVVNGLKHYKTLSSVSKVHHVGMYDAYTQCLQADSLDDRLKYFQLETGTIPIIAHENVFDMKLSHSSLCEMLDNMSQADVYHKQFFPYSDEVNHNTYGLLSTLCLKLHNPVLKKPRFGIIWTKQAAKFQKRKYMSDFFVSNRIRPISVNEVFHLFVILDDIVAKRTHFLKPFVKSLGFENIQSMFNVYNGFTLRESKKQTKKSFLDLLV